MRLQSLSLRKCGYFFLIFVLKVSGYLSTSNCLFQHVLLQLITVTHIALATSLTVLPFIFGSYILKQHEEFGFWAYIAVGVHTIICLGIVTGLLESFIKKHDHQRVTVALSTFKYESPSYHNKLNKVTVKFIIIFVIVSTLSYLHTLEYESQSKVQLFVIHYCKFMMVMKNLQLNIVADVLRIKLEFIRDELQTRLMYKSSYNPFIVKLKLFELRLAYEDILETATLINKCSSWTFLSMGITFIACFIAIGYWGLISILKNIVVFTYLRKY